MRLHLLILGFLLLLFSSGVKAQWLIKHLNETVYTWNNIIKFKNDSLGLFLGSNSVILKSIDAGETWKAIPLKAKINLYDFQFVGDSAVYAIGDVNGGSQLIKSADNGDSWDSIASFPGKQLYSLSFIDSKIGIVAGFDGIYRTADSGNHWNLVWSIPQFGYKYGDLGQICFPTVQIGYAIGLGRTQPGAKNNFDNFLLKTSDSGLRWDTLCTFKQSLTTVYFLNADTGFVGTESSIVLKTTNGGHTWSEKKMTDYWNDISSIQFISDKIGFVVGHQQAMTTGGGASTSFFISKTIDCGETWETFDSSGIPLNSIYFLNDSVGFVSGGFSLIMKTSGKINELPADYPWHLVDDGSSVKDMNDPNSFVKAFPNPTTGMLTLQLKSSAKPVVTIKLFSTSGQMIDFGNPKLDNNPIQIDLSRLGTGVYMIELTFSNKRELIKVIKN